MYPETEIVYAGFDKQYDQEPIRMVDVGITDNYRCTNGDEIEYKQFIAVKFVTAKENRESWTTTIYGAKL
eukprot:UN22663